MGRPIVVFELVDDLPVADLIAGGVFVVGCTLPVNVDCDLVVRGARDEVVVPARVVWVDGERGAGLQLECDAEVKQRLAAMQAMPAITVDELPDAVDEPEPPIELIDPFETPAEPAEAAAPAEPAESEVERKFALNVQQRLRGLTLHQQLKVARHGEMAERIVLERLYGKNVWEALLHNPRLTGPEVARIARMGTLPRILLELIVGNGTWLQIPEIRRALLANPRMGTDQILRVLRLLPKPELKLAAGATAYPYAVRDAAKRMLREDK
ncbi:MAG TPA: hypothetical protein VLX92_34260 [Kofleriaceae bacterium]|nr:hypothetical protein [Kofleriaceae bacterium]